MHGTDDEDGRQRAVRFSQCRLKTGAPEQASRRDRCHEALSRHIRNASGGFTDLRGCSRQKADRSRRDQRGILRRSRRFPRRSLRHAVGACRADRRRFSLRRARDLCGRFYRFHRCGALRSPRHTRQRRLTHRLPDVGRSERAQRSILAAAQQCAEAAPVCGRTGRSFRDRPHRRGCIGACRSSALVRRSSFFLYRPCVSPRGAD